MPTTPASSPVAWDETSPIESPAWNDTAPLEDEDTPAATGARLLQNLKDTGSDLKAAALTPLTSLVPPVQRGIDQAKDVLSFVAQPSNADQDFAYQGSPDIGRLLQTKPVKAIAGAGAGAIEQGEGIENLLGLGTLVLKAPKTLQRVLSAGFAVLGAKGAIDSANPLVKAVKAGDWGNAAHEAVNLLGGTAIAATAGAHAITGDVLPTTKGEPNATTESEQPGSVPTQRQGNDAGGPSAGRGAGGGVPGATPSETRGRQTEEAQENQVTPAIQVNGKVFTGKDHVDAYANAKANGQPDTSGAQEGFVDAQGKFITRQTAATETGLPTATEPGKLHSSDLPEEPKPIVDQPVNKPAETPPVAPAVDKTGMEALASSDKVSVKAPEGSTFIRVTTKDGKSAVQSIADFKKFNPFKGVEVDKVESGTKDKGGKFVPQKGDVQITEVQPKPSTVTPSDAGVHPSSQLQMAIVPGLKEFAEKDALPAIKAAASAVAESASELNSAFRAPNKSAESLTTAGILRHRAGELEAKDIQERAKLDEARKMFEKSPQAFNLRFIDNMENDRAQATPDLDKLSRVLRDAFNKRVADVRALGTGKLEKLIENYFPHLWEQPDAASNLFARIFGKRPFEGPKSFLKKRTIPTTADGIAAGLKPVSTNPVELTLLKLHEMDRYVMAHKVLNEMKDAGLAKFVRATEPTPDGYTKIDDRIADVYEGTTAQGSLAKRGSYYAPDDAARIINNYLSPGLRKFALFRGVLAASNVLNQFQLGLSAYHLRFTAIDSAVSKLALAIEQASRGDVSGAAKSAGIASTAPGHGPAVDNLIRGNKVLNEYTKPGTVGGDYARIVDALIKGGGRVTMDKYYKNSSIESFWKAFHEGNHIGAAFRAPFAAIEAASKPVMEVVVPRMKLGIFADMARMEMEKNPTMNLEQQRKVFGKIWDSVDNRMGQMVYDNLFWNKTLKDAAMLATRSLGWNLGTVRELGGAIKDTATLAARLKSGDPAVTHRMAYAISLPIVVGALGAMYQYLHTGKGPDELKDYFMPKTGRTLPDGSTERVILPTYVKDILPVVKAGNNFGTSGVLSRLEQMVVNKSGPILEMLGNMAKNRDFYGTEIANKNDPLVKQVGDELRFVASQFKPFSFQQYSHRMDKGLSAKYESFTGIMPAAAELTRTKAMQMISEYNKQHFGGTKTKEEAAESDLRYQEKNKLKTDPNAARKEIEEMVNDHSLTRRQANDLIAASKKDPRVVSFSRLPLDVAQEVYDAGTPEEKALWKPIMQAKIQRRR
jgi:hypothetical protein